MNFEREAVIVKYLAQGHKCHDRDSNPHFGESAPELEFDALNHSAMTLYSLVEATEAIASVTLGAPCPLERRRIRYPSIRTLPVHRDHCLVAPSNFPMNFLIWFR